MVYSRAVAKDTHSLQHANTLYSYITRALLDAAASIYVVVVGSNEVQSAHSTTDRRGWCVAHCANPRKRRRQAMKIGFARARLNASQSYKLNEGNSIRNSIRCARIRIVNGNLACFQIDPRACAIIYGHQQHIGIICVYADNLCSTCS